MDIKWLLSTPIAHRGLHGNGIPENSLLAFEAAINHGYSIETDVRLTKDGVLVCFHDDTALRMTGNPAAIIDLTYNELCQLSLADTDQKVPTFNQLLSLTDGKVGLLIEIKNTGSTGLLEQTLLNELQGYTGQYAIQSFNPLSVAWFYKNAPHITRGILSTPVMDVNMSGIKKWLLKKMVLNALAHPDFIAYDELHLPSKMVARRHKPTLAWTVRSQERADTLTQNGWADNVIFENFNAQK